MTTNIIAVLARVLVDDIDAALPFYVALSGGAEPTRFDFRDVSLAEIGPFLLLSGDAAAYTDRVATVIVQSLDPVVAALDVSGGTIVEGPSEGPTGRRAIVRHPDSAIFEYVERAAAATQKSL